MCLTRGPGTTPINSSWDNVSMVMGVVEGDVVVVVVLVLVVGCFVCAGVGWGMGVSVRCAHGPILVRVRFCLVRVRSGLRRVWVRQC